MAILLGQPVNKVHPLNCGRTGWWLGIGAPYSGGSTLGDLCNDNPASLNSPNYAVLRYQQPFLGLANLYSVYGTAGSSSTLNYANNFTLAATFHYDGNGAAQTLISHGQGGYCLRLNNGKLNFLQSNIADIFSGATTLSGGTWYRGMVTLTASGDGTLYVNGISDGTFSTAISFSGATGVLLGVDDYVGAGFGYYSGDYSIWNRVLSADEAKQDYVLSRMGYPSLFNRTKPGFISTVPAAGTAKPWHYYAQMRSQAA